MSKKFRDPRKNVVPLQSKKEEAPPQAPQIPPLGSDAGSLVAEWRRLQGILANIQVELNKRQEIVNKANTEMQQLQQNGLQINGGAQTLHRILTGMGVDPNKYTAPEEVPEEAPEPEFEPDFEPEEAELLLDEDVPPPKYRTALRRRFRQ